MVEVIKYGLIDDVKFFNNLENNYNDILDYDNLKLKEIISKSCEIKSLIIKNDEKENGKRALLNLGHTFGHAIESFSKYDGTYESDDNFFGYSNAILGSFSLDICPQLGLYLKVWC